MSDESGYTSAAEEAKTPDPELPGATWAIDWLTSNGWESAGRALTLAWWGVEYDGDAEPDDHAMPTVAAPSEQQLGKIIWETSRADEASISATGADIIARSILARFGSGLSRSRVMALTVDVDKESSEVLVNGETFPYYLAREPAIVAEVGADQMGVVVLPLVVHPSGSITFHRGEVKA